MAITITDKHISPVHAESRRELNIAPGSFVRVWQKIKENNKVRLQLFEGLVIARKHGNQAGGTFTVRRVGTDNIGIEKIYPLYSPSIDKIEVVRQAKVSRSKLYYLRDKASKEIKNKLRRLSPVGKSSKSESELAKIKVEIIEPVTQNIIGQDVPVEAVTEEGIASSN
ncbi:MAG: 50S ribosomal protein L19 [Alphaproteobacteria bacterium]|nr:50S ribosomal protein L19 [Alphaproteobacteria bacterium]